MSRTNHHRNQKRSWSVPSSVTRPKRKQERAKAKDAMKKGKYDVMPIVKHNDKYDHW